MRARLTPLLAALVLLLGACGDDEGDGEGDGTAQGPCTEASAPAAQQVDLEPPPDRPPADDLTAIVETSCGSFEIELATRDNPKTTASFVHLAKNGVYDGTPWHRIVPGFVIQGGDPQGTGTGGPGYSVDEPPPQDTAYTRGVVAMAKTEVEPPGRSGSQFFVVTGADAGLPPQYAVVGEVTSGFNVVRTIEEFGDPQSETGAPLEPVLIESVTIEER